MKYKYNYTYRFQEDGNLYAFDYMHLFLAQIDELYNACFDYLMDNISYQQLNEFGSKEEVEQVLASIQELIDMGYFFNDSDQRGKYKIVKDQGLISLPPVHRCNLRCAYCFAEQGNVFHGEQKEFTYEQVEKTLRFIYYDYMADYKKFRIDFVSGGEPLLNFDVIRYVREISNQLFKETGKPLEMWLCTNGTLLSEEILEYLDSNNINIGISLDGDQQQHDQLRKDYRGEGTYQRIVNNIKMIKESKKLSNHMKDIWGLVVITSKTKSIRDILLHHESIGLKNVQMKIARLDKSSEYAITMNNVDHVKAMYEELFQLFMQEARQQSVQHVLMILNDNDFAGKIIRRLLMHYGAMNRCQAGRTKVSIAANGDLYPCDSFVGREDFCLGNIETGVTKESPFINLTVDTSETCSGCWARYLCAGDCYHNSLLVNGSIHKPDPVICELEQYVIKKSLAYIDELSYVAPKKHTMLTELLKMRMSLLV